MKNKPIFKIARMLCLIPFYAAFTSTDSHGQLPTAKEVLMAYQANQVAPFRRSSFTSETHTEIRKANGDVFRGRFIEDIKLNDDGRVRLHTVTRGIRPEQDPDADRASPYVVDRLWNGREFYTFNNVDIQPDVRILRNNDSNDDIYLVYRAAPLVGIFAGSRRPFTEILADAPGISVSSELFHGHPCVVLSATTSSGSYRLYLDRDRGYAIRYAEVRQRGDDLYYGTPLSDQKVKSPRVPLPVGVPADAPIEHVFVLRDTEVFEVEGKPVLMTAKATSKLIYADGKYMEAVDVIRRADVVFQPDFGPDVFEPAFPNGTTVYISDPHISVRTPIQFEWRDRKPVPRFDIDVVRAIDKSLAEVEEKYPPLDLLRSLRPDADMQSATVSHVAATRPRHSFLMRSLVALVIALMALLVYSRSRYKAQ